MSKTPPPSKYQDRGEMESTRALLALPFLGLITYLATMIPFAVFLANGWDAAAILEPVAVLLVFNFLVGRYFP
jgi:hypothetical protein